MESDNKQKDEDDKIFIAKTPLEIQRLKLEKLMKNPDKPVTIPERPKDKSMPHVPDFVRNVMGSSAGAGSGEFHVYRHLRRKEYARQKFIQERAEKDLMDAAYHQKLEEHRRAAEERTAKKRAKRLKKKQKAQKRPKSENLSKSENSNSASEYSAESGSSGDEENK
ncbi:PRKR-interacting protein 1 homolog isoform X1 [Schistocerca americana]|uniref:PRKR-interacting protein 1 homolog isoform X1 n=1 Tax=Schistocerca americana TaxID=7009 RepID=UPI001F4FB120|nr:PRKR-interacting protein 1 homolog isoform X1 [Schistocerca americana]